MVFTNLQNNEKEAFFSLLDEYFTSRPEVLAHLAAQSQGTNVSAAASKAASAVQRAVASKPEIVSRFTSPASRHQANPSHTVDDNANEDEPEQPMSVAARMAAFAAKNNQPTPPPSRGPPAVAPKPTASGLVSSKTFGGIDTTSTKNALGSLYANRSSKPVEPPQPPPAPPAFPKRNNFAPPPTRGASSSVSPPPPPPRAASPEPEPEEEEPQGEWAEAIYDYSSAEPADLSFKEDERILIVERTSDDWWTGECNGRRGLLPASYVKLL